MRFDFVVGLITGLDPRLIDRSQIVEIATRELDRPILPLELQNPIEELILPQ